MTAKPTLKLPQDWKQRYVVFRRTPGKSDEFLFMAPLRQAMVIMQWGQEVLLRIEKETDQANNECLIYSDRGAPWGLGGESERHTTSNFVVKRYKQIEVTDKYLDLEHDAIALRKTYDGHWGEHPDFPIEQWQEAVETFDTRLGYWEWIANSQDPITVETSP